MLFIIRKALSQRYSVRGIILVEFTGKTAALQLPLISKIRTIHATQLYHILFHANEITFPYLSHAGFCPRTLLADATAYYTTKMVLNFTV